MLIHLRMILLFGPHHPLPHRHQIRTMIQTGNAPSPLKSWPYRGRGTVLRHGQMMIEYDNLTKNYLIVLILIKTNTKRYFSQPTVETILQPKQRWNNRSISLASMFTHLRSLEDWIRCLKYSHIPLHGGTVTWFEMSKTLNLSSFGLDNQPLCGKWARTHPLARRAGKENRTRVKGRFWA